MDLSARRTTLRIPSATTPLVRPSPQSVFVAPRLRALSTRSAANEFAPLAILCAKCLASSRILPNSTANLARRSITSRLRAIASDLSRQSSSAFFVFSFQAAVTFSRSWSKQLPISDFKQPDLREFETDEIRMSFQEQTKRKR